MPQARDSRPIAAAQARDPDRSRQRRHRRAARCRVYGDQGSDTLGNIARAVALRVPTLRRLGLERVSGVPAIGAVEPLGAFGRMAEASPGKDSVTGHWELMGLVLDRAVPDVSGRLSRRPDGGLRGAHRPRARSATRRPPAPRSSTSSGPSISRPASRSSTRRPTASSRSPRTRRSCRCRSCIAICEIAFELAARRPGRRPRHRAAVRRAFRERSRGPRTAATSR